jgi:pyroglutamyl-peptidase
MRPRTALVTAFEPFGGDVINASWEAAKRIDGWRCGEAIVAARLMPCAYGVCVDEFIAEYARLSPCAVLLTGQAARRGAVCVERVARNSASATARDNRAVVGTIAPGNPGLLATKAPTEAIARAIRDTGVAARVSPDAGDFVCNHLYYGVLRHLAARSQTTAAVFIHLPATPQQSPPTASARRLPTIEAVRALKTAVQVLLRSHSDRVGHAN